MYRHHDIIIFWRITPLPDAQSPIQHRTARTTVPAALRSYRTICIASQIILNLKFLGAVRSQGGSTRADVNAIKVGLSQIRPIPRGGLPAKA